MPQPKTMIGWQPGDEVKPTGRARIHLVSRVIPYQGQGRVGRFVPGNIDADDVREFAGCAFE